LTSILIIAIEIALYQFGVVNDEKPLQLIKIIMLFIWNKLVFG